MFFKTKNDDVKAFVKQFERMRNQISYSEFCLIELLTNLAIDNGSMSFSAIKEKLNVNTEELAKNINRLIEMDLFEFDPGSDCSTTTRASSVEGVLS